MFLSLKVAAFCRRAISSNFGCLQFPGDGVKTFACESCWVGVEGSDLVAILVGSRVHSKGRDGLNVRFVVCSSCIRDLQEVGLNENPGV
jgi:hypothetical protein